MKLKRYANNPVIIGGTLFVYYGGADRYVAVATCNVNELCEHLKSCPP